MANKGEVKALELFKINKSFGPQVALHDISLSFNEGDIVLLIGPNGSGKTTLLKILAGFLRPSSGHVKSGDQKIATHCFKELSYLGHASALYDPLTVRENLELVLALGGADLDPSSIIRHWGLSEFENISVAALSRGNEFKAALACAFSKTSKYRFFDEPTAALDQKGKELFFHALRNAHLPPCLTVLAAHDLRSLGGLINHVVVLQRGKVIKDLRGSFGESDLSALYLEACA